jgi:uncharacterized protein
VVNLAEYLALRVRPEGQPAMYHRWRDLTFLHFATDPELIAPMLPPGLTLDTYPDASGVERAWIGLVPFRMEGVRHRGTAAVPGCHAFPETNVRTYVHRDGKEPGVWFFSLDAANPVACVVARATFNLPYFPASMWTGSSDHLAEYTSTRWARRGQPGDSPYVKARLDLGGTLEPVEPGSLEFFLVERYVLYAYRRGRLYAGQVSHVPYPLREISTYEVSESLVAAAGIESRPWQHAIFSPGVDVEVFAIRAID